MPPKKRKQSQISQSPVPVAAVSGSLQSAAAPNGKLPGDVLPIIFSFLTEHASMRTICKDWKRKCEEMHAWKVGGCKSCHGHAATVRELAERQQALPFLSHWELYLKDLPTVTPFTLPACLERLDIRSSRYSLRSSRSSSSASASSAAASIEEHDAVTCTLHIPELESSAGQAFVQHQLFLADLLLEQFCAKVARIPALKRFQFLLSSDFQFHLRSAVDMGKLMGALEDLNNIVGTLSLHAPHSPELFADVHPMSAILFFVICTVPQGISRFNRLSLHGFSFSTELFQEASAVSLAPPKFANRQAPTTAIDSNLLEIELNNCYFEDEDAFIRFFSSAAFSNAEVLSISPAFLLDPEPLIGPVSADFTQKLNSVDVFRRIKEFHLKGYLLETDPAITHLLPHLLSQSAESASFEISNDECLKPILKAITSAPKMLKSIYFSFDDSFMDDEDEELPAELTEFMEMLGKQENAPSVTVSHGS